MWPAFPVPRQQTALNIVCYRTPYRSWHEDVYVDNSADLGTTKRLQLLLPRALLRNSALPRYLRLLLFWALGHRCNLGMHSLLAY